MNIDTMKWLREPVYMLIYTPKRDVMAARCTSSAFQMFLLVFVLSTLSFGMNMPNETL